MSKSKYLEIAVEKCNSAKPAMAKKTLISAILLAAIGIAAYIGFPLMDSRAASTATAFSAILGLLSLIFFVKFFMLIKKVNDGVIAKCEQEIEKNLKPGENFETFDKDISNPAFGEHIVDNVKVRVGHIFVLFESFTSSGPHFTILRGDVLGDFDVHYFTKNGIGTDIGVDIKDKNGKRIKSVMTSNKDKFYEMLNAMEQIKGYANGESIETANSSSNHIDPFVEDVKTKIEKHDKIGYTRYGVFGILFSIFLVIAGNKSGEGFIYGGFVLFVLSIIFIIAINIKRK